MIELKQIYQQFLRMGLLVAIIIPSLLQSQDPPEEFQFSQSTLQAFYFFNEVTIQGMEIQSSDWVAAFKGDICVGARQWDVFSCGGGLCDLPAMGDDGSEYAVGYMEIGDVPTFKIYDASSGSIFHAVPSAEVDPWSINGFSMNETLNAELSINSADFQYNGSMTGAVQINNEPAGALGDLLLAYVSEEIRGISDAVERPEALGGGIIFPLMIYSNLVSGDVIELKYIDTSIGEIYNLNEIFDFSSDMILGDAEVPIQLTGGICEVEVDLCNVCDGDNSTCTGCMDELACNFDESNIVADNTTCEYAEENYDCLGDCTIGEDCLGICGGTAELDECNICNGDNSTCTDCAGIPNGDAELDNCEVCDSDSTNDCTQDCNGDWGGAAELDGCDVCNGDNSTCTDCAGIPNGDAELDNCGVCDSDLTNDCTQDCNGDWGGAAIFDDCGICDGGSECSGQIVQGQCVNGEFNIGEFNVSGFDCSGWCLGTFSYSDDSCYDCEGTPDGDAWESDCGCVAADNTGDDCDDCDGIPNGDAIVDECGVCDGDGLSCLFGCNDVNATNYYCDVYGCEDEETPEGFLDDGSCTYDIEGTVIYFAPFFPQNYIENVTVILFAQTIDEFGQIIGEVYTDTTSTGVNGIFSFDEVSSNYDYYYFLFSYLESSDNYHNGINNTDALLIANVVVADTTFAYPIHSSIAADVNLDGRINSYDSSLIGRFMNDSSFSMNDLEVRWKFVSEIDTINDITNLTGNDNIIIHGIKLGDPNGSWE